MMLIGHFSKGQILKAGAAGGKKVQDLKIRLAAAEENADLKTIAMAVQSEYTRFSYDNENSYAEKDLVTDSETYADI